MDSTRTKLEIWLFMVLLTSTASLEARLVFGGDLVLGPKVLPCLYIFGDSLFDNGNNNDLVAAPKANYHPYGIDFPGGATGRFSNGRNIMDFIVEFLGFEEFIQPFALATDVDLLVGVNYASGGSGILDETGVHLVNYLPYGVDFPDGPTGRFSNGRNIADYVAELLDFTTSPPPFAAATDQDLLTGVNYASGGSGILDESGSQLGDRISLNQQISHHEASISRIESLLLSKQAASDHLHKCIFAVNMGSNDYINNYLLPQFYNSSNLYTPQQYADKLIKQYSQDIMNLYNSGARKVALFGLGQIGCTPAERALAGKDGCVDTINENVQLFNAELKSLVVGLNNVFSDAKFIFIDVTEITTVDLFFIRLSITNKPCCPVSTTDAGRGQCLRNGRPCLFRDAIAFYDGFHPSQIASNLIASGSYYSLLPSYTYPYGIRHLAKL